MSANHEEKPDKDTFLNNMMKAFVTVILTIGLVYIRNWMSTNNFFKEQMALSYLVFSFIVIIFLLIITGIQGSSFMSLISLVMILVSITMIIWSAAGMTQK